jgi:hypothetical protein
MGPPSIFDPAATPKPSTLDMVRRTTLDGTRKACRTYRTSS